MRRLNRAERLVKPHWPSELISIAPQPHPDLSYAMIHYLYLPDLVGTGIHPLQIITIPDRHTA